LAFANDRPAKPEDYIQNVDTVCKKFDGQWPVLPDAVFAKSIVSAQRDALAGQPENVVEEFQNGFLAAIQTMRESASAQWRN